MDIKEVATLQMEPYIAASERIRSYIITKGYQLKRLISEAIFIPFATLALCCIAKLSYNIDKIEKKLVAIQRIVKEIQKKSVSQTKVQVCT